jgi:GT2 family glycosyltransferase
VANRGCTLGAMDRPAVDVVVPFVGTDGDLRTLCEHLGGLRRRDDDSLIVVDNRPDGRAARERTVAGVQVLDVPDLQSSYHARNRGVGAGAAPWLLFIDADVRVPPDLIERYFDPAPSDTTAIIAGEIVNPAPTAGQRVPLAVRYAYRAQLLSQENTMTNPDFAYAMTANCAIRRDAFEAAGGFVANIRSGGDAEICLRLRACGWGIERRRNAVVTHTSRDSLRKLLRQAARHGSGAAWLQRRYPGFSRPSRLPGLLLWSSGRFAAAIGARLRGDGNRALIESVDAARALAFELGRRAPNERPGHAPA